MDLRSRLEQYFQFKPRGADWRTEILAGFTTFMTMAYIVFVNPVDSARDGHAAGRGHGGDLPFGGDRQLSDGRLGALSRSRWRPAWG